MNLIPLVISWGLLALTVLGLFLWRKAVASNEDDSLHVLDAGAVQRTASQAAVAQKLELIDKWGKILTVVAVVFGAIVGGLFVYQSWLDRTNLGA